MISLFNFQYKNLKNAAMYQSAKINAFRRYQRFN